MQHLKAVFKDTHGLHARIDTFLGRSSVLKIGLVPQASRERTSGLLHALVDEPIQATAWSAAIARRPLTKDTLVVQSPSFEFVETQNSLAVYPVPFSGAPVEYLEVNSALDSWDHLKTCHLQLLLTDRVNGEVQSTPYPSLTVIDSSSAAGAAGAADAAASDIEYRGEIVNVDSHMALAADAMLQESPAKTSDFLELRKRSHIDALKALFDQKKVYAALKDSIIRSCQSQISDMQLQLKRLDESGSGASAAEWREVWTRNAHRELQGYLLPRLRRALYHDLSFYKLYARTDDVESIISQVVDQPLPESQAQLQFLSGKLNVSPSTKGMNIGDNLSRTVQPATLRLQNTALKSVLTALFGVQLPLIALSAAGFFAAGFNWFSTGALASLGIVAGLKKLQNEWVKATSSYEQLVRDEAVKSIQAAEKQLWEFGEQSSYNAISQIKIMDDALNEAQNALNKKN